MKRKIKKKDQYNEEYIRECLIGAIDFIETRAIAHKCETPEQSRKRLHKYANIPLDTLIDNLSDIAINHGKYLIIKRVRNVLDNYWMY